MHERRDRSTHDPFELERFVAAQSATFATATDELRAGRKRSHWMWFVFPQCAGLGHSATAQRYAIRSLDEARAYLAHAVLGARLVECTRIVNALDGLSARRIFAAPDDLKFQSSMTLFECASQPGSVFAAALDTYFAGTRDAQTLRWLDAPRSGCR